METILIFFPLVTVLEEALRVFIQLVINEYYSVLTDKIGSRLLAGCRTTPTYFATRTSSVWLHVYSSYLVACFKSEIISPCCSIFSSLSLLSRFCSSSGCFIFSSLYLLSRFCSSSGCFIFSTLPLLSCVCSSSSCFIFSSLSLLSCHCCWIC